MGFSMKLSGEIMSVLDKHQEKISDKMRVFFAKLNEKQQLEILKQWDLFSPYEKKCLPSIEIIFVMCEYESACQYIIDNFALDVELIANEYDEYDDEYDKDSEDDWKTDLIYKLVKQMKLDELV